jgi:Tol biopolymer transport system component
MNSSNTTALTTDGRLKRDPHFWPGGRELIYTAEAPGTGRMRLMRLNLENRTTELFHRRADMSDREISISADGSAYAFNRVEGLNARIIVSEGGKQVSVPISVRPNVERVDFAHWPALAPEGSLVVFSEGAGPLMAYDWRRNGGLQTLVQLTPMDATYSDIMPHFSPDGRSIVFVSRRDDDMEIYRMRPDGSEQTRLTRSPGIDIHPVYSPDGRRIAFTSNRDGKYEIYVMNADGSNVLRATTHAEHNNHPCWHPDGRRLVFVGERNGRHDLYQCPAPV